MREPDSKVISVGEILCREQKYPKRSTLSGIVSCETRPKNRKSEVPQKLRRKFPDVLKNEFPASTAIRVIRLHESAPTPMILRLAGMRNFVRELHPEKAFAPISRNREPDSHISRESRTHFKKQESSMISTEEGMQIDFNLSQDEKAQDPIRWTIEFPSNLTSEREEQCAKHSVPIVLTFAGMQIDCSLAHFQNALARIRVSVEPNSNLTFASFWEPAKDERPIVSILAPILTSRSLPKYRIR
jgi:hypothetical protein